jgi:hypothetical protein
MAPKKVYRSAITGRFVKPATAHRHPCTTVTHTIKSSRSSAGSRKRGR